MPQAELSRCSEGRPFVIATGDARPRDLQELMERPFFSLSKTPRRTPIFYQSGAIEVEVRPASEQGIATIWDADILIWITGQIVEARNSGFETCKHLRFVPFHMLQALGRGTGSTDYQLLKAALARLRSTIVRTTIRSPGQHSSQQFAWIDEWQECLLRSGKAEGMEAADHH